MTLTTAEILVFLATHHFVPLSDNPTIRREMSDASQTALYAIDTETKLAEPGAMRVYLLDPEQSSVDVIDLWSSVNPNEIDPAVRVILSAPQVCG